MPSSNQNVNQRIGELAHIVHADESLECSLRRVADTALEVMNRCDSASVSMSQDGQVSTWASTDAAATRVDECQYQADTGPCLDAIRTGQPNFVESLASEERWAKFTSKAVAEGMVASYSVPLKVSEETVGALNLYSRSKPFAYTDLQVADMLAAQAAVTLANAQAFQEAQERVVDLEEALESREVTTADEGALSDEDQ